MTGPKGIDYYIGDGTPSLAGDTFIVIKASEGASYPPPGAPEDTWYPQEQARIRAVGAVFGAYLFWHPGDDNAAQLENYRQHANLKPGDVIQLDAEVTDGLDWATVNIRKNDMLSRLKAAFPQCRVLLYTYLSYWNSLDGTAADGLWIADPNSPAGQPQVPHWVIHQYATSGVDYDVANFVDAAALRAWATALIPAPPPALPKEDEMILTDIKGSSVVWGLSGSLYWPVADVESIAAYRAAHITEVTITPAEHAAILAAVAAAKPTIAATVPVTLTGSGTANVSG